MPSGEHIRGRDSCSIQKFEGLPGKSKEIKPQTAATRKSLYMEDIKKASFQTTISIKEEK